MKKEKVNSANILISKIKWLNLNRPTLIKNLNVDAEDGSYTIFNNELSESQHDYGKKRTDSNFLTTVNGKEYLQFPGIVETIDMLALTLLQKEFDRLIALAEAELEAL